jgi:hypothetical protein
MNLESQVCNLELAKKLKELCVKQESLFYWSKLSIQTEYKLELRRHMQTQEIILADCTDYIAAFTVAELIYILHDFTENINIPKGINLGCYLGGVLIEFLEKSTKKD